MELNVVVPGQTGQQKVTVLDTVFNREYSEGLIHQVLTAYAAGIRSGTKAQKTRGEVSGGGKKPWKQKHTGRARFGSIRVPSWRKGGVVFAAKPRDYSQKVNKKMYREALRAIFSELVRQERIIVVDQLALAEAKTKMMKALLEQLGVQEALIVLATFDENIYLAARNLPRILVVEFDEINPLSLVRFEKIILSTEVVKKIEEWLK